MIESITILLADDHAVVRAGIRQFLESADGLRVVAEADDGDAARRLIAAHRDDPYAPGWRPGPWVRPQNGFAGRDGPRRPRVYEGKQVLDPAIRARAVALETVYEPLSGRELEVLALAARGYTNKAISAQLFISDRTVQGHLAHIYAKLRANTRTDAVMRAVALGLITL
ncbi:MAG: response regulator transcription factor [Rhodospirillales bacterium]|nr:response regulator transcription factor [Rhodospirillales bacterium]